MAKGAWVAMSHCLRLPTKVNMVKLAFPYLKRRDINNCSDW